MQFDSRSRKPFQVHLRNHHGRCSSGHVEAEAQGRAGELYAFALVVCVRDDGKILLVHEFAGAGFWLPGGRVEPNETLQDAAIRETKEESGIDVELVGVILVQHTPHRHYTRLRVVFMARPRYDAQLPKSLPDYESVGASWVDMDAVSSLPLRGRDPLVWVQYLKDGGQVYPMSVLGGE